MLLKFVLTTCLAVMADCQHLPKIGRLPSISSSLVNLGKMDISFHFNSHGHENSAQRAPEVVSTFPAPSSFLSPSFVSETSGVCPCMRNTMKYNPHGNPSDILSKILMSNDLFTNNKEPISSSLCCGSMEHVEETVIVDLSKPQVQSFNSILPAPSLPFALDTLYKPPTLPKMPVKSKGIEVFFYPNKKDMAKLFPKKTKKSQDWERVHPVGDKGLLNDFLNIRAFPPIKTSVKKDLKIQEKAIGKIDEEPANEVKIFEIVTPKEAKVAKDIAKDINDIAKDVNNAVNDVGVAENKKV